MGPNESIKRGQIKLTNAFLGRDKTKSVLECSRPDQDHVLMEGKIGKDALTVQLKRIDPSKFLLLNRGFHWIQEGSLIR